MGVIGAGTFGTQLIAQSINMKGIRIAGVCDVDLQKAVRAYSLAGVAKEEISDAKDIDSLNKAVEESRPAVTSRSEDLTRSGVDLIVEATGVVGVAVKNAHDSIRNRKHLVLVTVEADVLCGPILKKMADEAGLVYSLVYGDEPSVAFEIFDRAKSLGFRIVAAGKGARFIPEYRKATPDNVFEKYDYAAKGDVKANPKMFNSFLDGTKHSAEMVALSNMSGLTPDVRGMHFPALDLREMPDQLALRSKGGILGSEGVVEVASSIHPDGTAVERSIRGGVYCVVEAASRYLREAMESYGMILGIIMSEKTGYALLYRPQHLVGLEAPISIARVAVYHESTGAPSGWFSEVITVAKKRLTKGTVLDGEGGYTAYGLAERAEVSREGNLLPFGLSQNAVVRREIAEDGAISYDDVELQSSAALTLRQVQETSVKPGASL